MDNINYFEFLLSSVHNQYTLELNIIKDNEPEKLEISLTYKIDENEMKFVTQKSLKDFANEDEFFEDFKSIKDIMNYLTKIIQPKNVKIEKINTKNHRLKLVDIDKDQTFRFLLQKEIGEKEIKNSEIISISISRKKEMSKSESNQNSTNLTNTGQNNLDNNISLNNNKSFFNNEEIISNEEEICDNFTTFVNKRGENIIVWSINGKGIIYLYDIFTKNKSNFQTHTNKIDSIEYFKVYNNDIDYLDYIITFSILDENDLKIWLLEDEDDIKLICKTQFKKNLFKINIELFCFFNNYEYDKDNIFLFIYGDDPNKYNNNNTNIKKYSRILCYKLDKNFNIQKEEFHQKLFYHKAIVNCQKVNYLDTYYDSKEKELYIINCNEQNVESITKPFNCYKGIVFKYKDWINHKKAFIIEINNGLKLIEINIKGVVIWNMKNNVIPEIYISLDFPIFDIIYWGSETLMVSGENKILKLYILNDSGKIINEREYKGKSKVKKISLNNEKDALILIDDSRIKYTYS